MKKICLLLAMLILISCFVGCGGNDASQKIVFEDLIIEMKGLYPLADSRWPEDDSYMKLLWNPNGGGLARQQILDDTIEGIKFVNKKLGFTDALFEKMAETTEANNFESTDTKEISDIKIEEAPKQEINIGIVCAIIGAVLLLLVLILIFGVRKKKD